MIQEMPYVASVEVLITMSDGSANSLVTTKDSVIEACVFGMQRATPPDFACMEIRPAPTPVVELTMTIDGHDIRYIMQHHPAPKETQ